MNIVEIEDSHWPGIMAVEFSAYIDVEPETLEVLQSKWRATPETCFVCLSDEGAVEAYLLAHRWSGTSPPKLFTQLKAGTGEDVLYLHDLAVHQNARGKGLANQMVDTLKRIAKSENISQITLVAVQDSSSFWEKQGFRAVESVGICESYGDNARYMKVIL